MLPETVKKRLEALGTLSRQGKRINGLYRLMESPDLWLQAYAKIYANKGATTKGVDRSSMDGFSMERAWKELVAWIRSFGYPVRPIPYDKWRAQLLDLGRFQESAAYHLLPLFSMSLSEAGPRIVRSIPEFDCQNTRDALAGTSIVCPPVDSRAFESYLSYFMRRGFLDAPPAGGTFRGLSNVTAEGSSTPMT